MNLEKSNRLFILAIAAALLLVGTTVFLQGQSIMKMQESLSAIADSMSSTKNTEPAQAPDPTAKVYVSCRYEHLDKSTTWGDAKLFCKDGDGKESMIFSSISEKLLNGESQKSVKDGVVSVYSMHFVPDGQMLYVRFRSEADVTQYGLAFYNLRTNESGGLPNASPGEYVPETSAHFSEDGKFLAVAGGIFSESTSFVDLQTIYVYDLRTAELLSKIVPERANMTFLAETDCFRQLGDIQVYWRGNELSYRAYDKPIEIAEDEQVGTCDYQPKGGFSRRFKLPL